MAFKKIMSAVMAGAMVLSMGMTAFAASTEPNFEGTDPLEIPVISGTQIPTIQLIVPEAVGMIANPYRLEVKNEELQMQAAESSQIISPVQYIQNKSDVAIDVKASIYGEAAETVKIVAAEGDVTKDNKKNAYIAFQMAKTAGTTAPADWTSPADELILNTTATAENPITSSNAVQMKAKTSTTENAIAFHFTGKLQDDPETAWTEDDFINAGLIFNFTAVANADGGSGSTTETFATLTIDKNTLSLAGSELGNINATLPATVTGTINYASSDNNVATVNTSGVVTPVAVGTCTINVTATGSDGKNYSGAINITVGA